MHRNFPKLNSSNYRETSPRDRRYNCIAWAAGDNTRFWWPDPSTVAFWPPGAPRLETVDAFVEAFRTLGYAPCTDGAVEAEYEKVAIYATREGEPTHAARQLPSGLWTSKLGRENDIEHTADGVDGPLYGMPVRFMRRPR